MTIESGELVRGRLLELFLCGLGLLGAIGIADEDDLNGLTLSLPIIGVIRVGSPGHLSEGGPMVSLGKISRR